MIRDVSTSTIGREEVRKPEMAAYMFQRRVLLGCSFLMILSLLLWIIAVATDHWIIISGGQGIFIPETRRFFMNSHSGLWRYCRSTIIPNALTNSNVIRNFTSLSYANSALLNEAKLNVSRADYIENFMKLEENATIEYFTEDQKRKMFAHWLRNDTEFSIYKHAFHKLVLNTDAMRAETTPTAAKPISIDPLDIKIVERNNTFGKALQKLTFNSTSYLFVIPEIVQTALFEGWSDKPFVPKLLWPFARDLELSAFVLNEHGVILQLVPPLPPKKGRNANGYEYIPNRRCKYIEMIPDSSTNRFDPGFDEDLMDYVRTQASFACITIFVMCLGVVFSFYTFMNPRYMFKRLAGGILLVSGSTAIVVLQVLFASVEYTKENLLYSYPSGAELRYGYGVYMAWCTFIINIFCGIMYMWYSGKKKGSKAPTDELGMADEPTIMGR